MSSHPSGEGLSPRGRGNRGRSGGYNARRRSIPAWAGEPWPLRWVQCSEKVYPRVGGGTVAAQVGTMLGEGLSPRGRGNLAYDAPSTPLLRSIPAWAGGTACLAINPKYFDGLSPRGRGNRFPFVSNCIWEGSIPAWAGEPDENTLLVSAEEVYPRVGGGTSIKASSV